MFLSMFCLKFLADCYVLIYIHCQELMKSVDSYGSLSLIFVTKVMF